MTRNYFDRRTVILLVGTWLMLVSFALLWSYDTTFRGMGFTGTYINSLLLTLIITLPYFLTRRLAVQAVVAGAVWVLMECNLMYCRVYYAPIPLDAYSMAGNLADFKASVVDCLRLRDVIPLLLLIITVLLASRAPRFSLTRRESAAYLALTAGCFGVSLILAVANGGFRSHITSLKESCYFSTTPMCVYTVGGELIYQFLDRDSSALTASDVEAIDKWIADNVREAGYNINLIDSTLRRDNLVIILCESLESWVIGAEVNGRPITPNLNRLVADSTTLYAPNILTQVDAGRSIDAQLLIQAGMLPVKGSVYSMRFSGSTYPSIVKAIKEGRGARSYLLTCDKPTVWNQAPIAASFGFDTLVTKDSWRNDERVGNPPKLSDGSFMLQSVEKLKSGELWPDGENAYILAVTYSGHNPFRLPENLRDPEFKLPAGLPETLADYITMAHYTDASLASMIEYLKSRPDYDRTMLVITGDHEALGTRRDELRNARIAGTEVSAGQFVPLLILNSPRSGHIDGVAGQVDIYTTLLTLMGLNEYEWRGMGRDISSGAPGMAISSMTGITEGDTASVTPERLKLLRSARDISDLIIRKNYFGSHSSGSK